MNALFITCLLVLPANWADDDTQEVCKCWRIEAVPAVYRPKPEVIKYELV